MKYIATTRILDHLGRFTIILKRYIGQSCKFCQSIEGLSTFKDDRLRISQARVSQLKQIIDEHQYFRKKQ